MGWTWLPTELNITADFKLGTYPDTARTDTLAAADGATAQLPRGTKAVWLHVLNQTAGDLYVLAKHPDRQYDTLPAASLPAHYHTYIIAAVDELQQIFYRFGSGIVITLVGYTDGGNWSYSNVGTASDTLFNWDGLTAAGAPYYPHKDLQVAASATVWNTNPTVRSIIPQDSALADKAVAYWLTRPTGGSYYKTGFRPSGSTCTTDFGLYLLNAGIWSFNTPLSNVGGFDYLYADTNNTTFFVGSEPGGYVKVDPAGAAAVEISVTADGAWHDLTLSEPYASAKSLVIELVNAAAGAETFGVSAYGDTEAQARSTSNYKVAGIVTCHAQVVVPVISGKISMIRTSANNHAYIRGYYEDYSTSVPLLAPVFPYGNFGSEYGTVGRSAYMPFAGTADFGLAGAETAKWCMFGNGCRYRIRQTGTISKVRLYVGSVTNLSTFVIDVWRYNGTAGHYEWVGSSEDIKSKLTAGTINEVTLDTPITGVHEYDFLGFHFTGTAANFFYKTSISSQYGLLYTFTADPGHTNVNWHGAGTTATSDTNAPIIQAFMSSAPTWVAIGDSITGGTAETGKSNISCCRNLAIDFANTFHPTTPYIYQLSELIGSPSFQNHGIGGDLISSGIVNRLAQIKELYPQYAILLAGVNDADGAIADATYAAALKRTILGLCEIPTLKMIYLVKILPWTNGSLTEHSRNIRRDSWNGDVNPITGSIISWDNYVGVNGAVVQVVDPRSTLGVDHADAYAGNLWEIQTSPVDFDADGVHYTYDGYTALANYLKGELAVYIDFTGTVNVQFVIPGFN